MVAPVGKVKHSRGRVWPAGGAELALRIISPNTPFHGASGHKIWVSKRSAEKRSAFRRPDSSGIFPGMPDYRRNRVPGGTFLFTVNLRDTRSDLLVTQIDILRNAVRRVRAREPPPSCRRGVNPFELSAPAVGGFDGDEGASRLRRSWLSRRSPLEARDLKTPRR